MNLLITGAAGFIGQNFYKYMQANYPSYNLYAVDMLSDASDLGFWNTIPEERKVAKQIGEISSFPYNWIYSKKIDTVVNFAALSHVDNSISDPTSFTYYNVMDFHDFLQGCKESNIQRFIQVGTDEVYGSLGPHDHPFTEKNPNLYVYKKRTDADGKKSEIHFQRVETAGETVAAEQNAAIVDPHVVDLRRALRRHRRGARHEIADLLRLIRVGQIVGTNTTVEEGRDDDRFVQRQALEGEPTEDHLDQSVRHGSAQASPAAALVEPPDSKALKNCPMMPLVKATGMKTARIDAVVARTAKLLLDLSDYGRRPIDRRACSISEMAARISTVPEAISRSMIAIICAICSVARG